MKLARIVTLTLLFGFAVAAGAAAQTLPDVDRFGPQVGETVPSFSLVDQRGASRDLQSLAGPNGLMLVFSRSADW
jgi:cytochrome oxidase Cu insertion factor (SCO1/SenC/PrrC family)